MGHTEYVDTTQINSKLKIKANVSERFLNEFVRYFMDALYTN